MVARKKQESVVEQTTEAVKTVSTPKRRTKKSTPKPTAVVKMEPLPEKIVMVSPRKTVKKTKTTKTPTPKVVVKKEKVLTDNQVRHLCIKTAAEFDYAGLLNHNPVWRDPRERSNGFDIISLIIDIAKSISYTQMNGAINDLLHPAEYNYSKEILEKVRQIEENLAALTQITQLVAYQEAINHRRELITALATTTTPYYDRYITLCRRLSENISDATRTNIIIDMKKVVTEWSELVCNGTNIYFCCQNLMNMMSNSNVCLGHSYPGIFDVFGDYSSVWAAQSYPMREVLREEDKYAVFSSLVLTKAYFQIKAEDKKDPVAKDQLTRLLADAERYTEFMRAHEAEIGGCADCTLPGAEAQLSCNWTGISYKERATRAKNEEWRFNKKNKYIRKRFYYGDESQSMIDKYPTAEWLEKLCAFYDHTKTIYEIFSLNKLVVNDVVVRCFNGLDPHKWIVVQGDMSWDRKAVKKNHDTIYITMVNMNQKNCGASNQAAVVNCNIKGIGFCPTDSDPDYVISNSGDEGTSCGIYETMGRTPTPRK